jgi:hypothetical protein
VTPVYAANVTMAAGPGITMWFNLNMSPWPASATVLVGVAVDATTMQSVSRNVIALTSPENLKVPETQIRVSVASSLKPDGSASVTLTSDAVGVYVVLTTLAHGRFSDNALLLLPPSLEVSFLFFGEPNLQLLAGTIRVEDLWSIKSF